MSGKSLQRERGRLDYGREARKMQDAGERAGGPGHMHGIRQPVSGNWGIAMRKIILVVLLATASGSASAEWVNVGDAKNLSMYADPATIRKSGNMVKMWSLSDYKEARTQGGRSLKSQKSQLEFDCKEERVRTLFWSWFSENMGGGEHVHSNAAPDAWIPVAPGTLNELLWKIACGKD